MRLLTACFVVSLVLVNPYLRGDGNGYYAWLRSPLIDGDVDFGNEYLHADPLFRSAFVDETGAPTPAMRTPTGKVENQWSIGPALLWAPAFGVAHLAARAGVAPDDGLSPPYLWLTAMSTAIYGFIAVLLGIDLSRRFGFQGTSVLAGAAVLFASSLPVYMYLVPFHVHAIAAFASGLFFWWGVTRVSDWSPRAWAIWGATAGLMVVVYYVHAVFLLAVAAALLRPGAMRARVRAVTAFGLASLPFLLLHGASRLALYGSMTQTGYRDRFYWESPRLIATAFSPEHGLFLWTPVVLVALVGLAMIARRDPRARVLLMVWAVLFYVIASYQNWHGQSSFGNRFFVSLTTIFVPGVAAALAWLAARARALPVALVTVLALWNAGFVFQWGLNIVPNRGPVDFALVARNQVSVVPARLGAVVSRYFSDRAGLRREVEAGDSEERRQYRLGR